MDGPDAGEGPDHRRGFWVSEAAWPSPNIDSLALHLSKKGALSESAGEEAAMAVASPLTTGLGGGRFYPKHGRVDLAVRSEEHTSELQSLMRTSYAVFCLKKKKTKKICIENNNDSTTITLRHIYIYRSHHQIQS